jgi:hypothetical protein
MREVGGTAANNPLPGNSKENLVHRETGEDIAVASPQLGAAAAMRACGLPVMTGPLGGTCELFSIGWFRLGK